MSENFGAAGHNLRAALAKFARKIITVETEVAVKDGRSCTNLEAHTACRLIPLDKKPGVRPIGVGEVLRRIIEKSHTFSDQTRHHERGWKFATLRWSSRWM